MSEADDPRPVLVCFAGDVWDGNPHSRHHLMRRLAGEFEVLFVEGIPMRSVARIGRSEARRIVHKLAARSGLRTVHPGLHVLRPWPIPPAGAAGRALQLAGLRRQVEGALRRLNLRGPRALWFSLPNVALLLGRLKERGALLYYQDRYEAFSHVDVERLRADLATLARSCDATVATAGVLADDLVQLGAKPLTVPHGVDLQRFTSDSTMPEDLRSLPRPLVGHVGLLDDHISTDLLLATADAIPAGTLALVGGANIDVAALRSHPRIALLGRRPYDAMPAYIAAFDCCLIPFKVNRLTVAVNPIKLREYLAVGRPVVSVSLPEVLPYADVVRIAKSRSDFAGAVTEVLARPDGDDVRSARRARVELESWDVVAESLAAIIRTIFEAGVPSKECAR